MLFHILSKPSLSNGSPLGPLHSIHVVLVKKILRGGAKSVETIIRTGSGGGVRAVQSCSHCFPLVVGKLIGWGLQQSDRRDSPWTRP